MAGTTQDSHSSAAGDALRAPKRRKLRKGTQSCWECKRRKTRCTFAADTDSVCDGCRSRQVKCISQEVHDDVGKVHAKADRLSRMESLIEQLVHRGDTAVPISPHSPSTTKNRCVLSVEPINSSDQTAVETSESSGNYYSVCYTTSHNESTDNLNELSAGLLAVWPIKYDLDLISSVPVDTSILFHGVIFKPYQVFFSNQSMAPAHLLSTIPRDWHPVLISRRLLMLGALIQGMPSSSIASLIEKELNPRDIMSRVVKTAARLVTSNDELPGTVDRIECVMIESMYHNNAGDFRRAWLLNRRAMALAQTIGLHTGTSLPSIYLTKNTRSRIDPDYMWFRIVASDRYLSLMLGLPHGSPEDHFATTKVLANCAPLERMERMETVAGGLILQRNGTGQLDFGATYKIDKLLQAAAAEMPPKWWSMASNLTSTAGNDGEAFEEIIRFMFQLVHQHLLVQLYLPYVVTPLLNNLNHLQGRMTAANASREILTRFLAFRDAVSGNTYCRGIDFIAFIATTVLCLVHVDARHQRLSAASHSLNILQSSQHQHLSDRGLLERVLGVMESRVKLGRDACAERITDVLRPLLAIDVESAAGQRYLVSVSPDTGGGISPQPPAAGDTGVLHIKIPYFGTISIDYDADHVHLETIFPTNSFRLDHHLQADSSYHSIASQFQQPDPIYPGLSSADNAHDLMETGFAISGLEAEADEWELEDVDMTVLRTVS